MSNTVAEVRDAGTTSSNGSPDAADEPTKLDINEARLGGSLSEISDGVSRVWESWRVFVEQEIDARLTALLSDAAREHQRHLESHASRVPDAEGSGHILEYRRGVEKDVVTPLLNAFHGRNVGRALQARFGQTIDALGELGDKVESEVRLSRRARMFEPADGDGPVVSVRKMGRRTWIGISSAASGLANAARRLVGKEALPSEPPSRVVQARKLVDYYLQVEIPALVWPQYAEVQLRVARRIANLERALTNWANDLLTVEREVEVLFESSVKPNWEAVAHTTTEPKAEDAANTDVSNTDEDVLQGEHEESDPDPSEKTKGVAKRLQEQLEELARQPSHAPEEDETSFSGIFERLESDVSRAGTFLLKTSDRSAGDARATTTLMTDNRWPTWHDQVVDRLCYIDQLLLIRDRMLRAESSIVDRTSRATVMSVIQTFADVKSHFSESLDDDGGGTTDADALRLAKEIQVLRDRLSSVLADVLKDLPGLVSSDLVLSHPGRDEWEGLGKFVDSLPEQLVMHELYDEDEEITAKIRTAEVNFRGLVNDVVLIQLPDRLRKPAEALRAAVRRVWTETEQVQHIVQYNLDAAIDELRGTSDSDNEAAGTDDGEQGETRATPADRISRAHQLTEDGIARASNTLDQLATSLREPWEAFVQAIDHELREDWVAIHRRLKAADSADEQWAGFQARATRQVERVMVRLRKSAVTVGQRAGKWIRAGRRRAQSLIRIGQSAVGVAESGESARFETVDAISSVPELRSSLPLIYRRLFSFEPLEEPSLLEGRARDLVWMKQHLDRWHDAMQLGVVLIQAPLGSGRTSFLHALNSSVLKDHDVKFINLSERLYHPDEFAAIVADALGLDTTGITIDELEEQLTNTRRADPPHVCMIDNVEHLLMRAAQSVNVIERVILFMSRTDSSIYWIGTIGAHAWQFLSKTAGTSVSFVDSYELTSLDRTTVESLIISRHRRSGMPLHFPVPQDPPPLMRQRLRRAKTPEQQQALLREDYFDRLWKASGENIMLALYYWIRSADFSNEDGPLEVQPLRPLNFDFFSQFDLDQAFTLKAFFLHKTLSLADHSRVFHMSADASTAILESLLNLHIIEQVPQAERVRGDYHVRRDAVYRLKPLLIHPVTTFLQSKNIVY